jgi:hypothetical protein
VLAKTTRTSETKVSQKPGAVLALVPILMSSTRLRTSAKRAMSMVKAINVTNVAKQDRTTVTNLTADFSEKDVRKAKKMNAVAENTITDEH